MDYREFGERYRSELNRLGLDEDGSPYGILASDRDGAAEEFLAHLRSLPVGASWRDVFPDLPEHWDLDDPDTWKEPERSLGPFDFPEAPRGGATFASLDMDGNVEAGETALREVTDLGIPIYGAGLVLDRGHPHLFVVLPMGAPAAHLDRIADFLRDRQGIGNAYPYRYESHDKQGT